VFAKVYPMAAASLAHSPVVQKAVISLRSHRHLDLSTRTLMGQITDVLLLGHLYQFSSFMVVLTSPSIIPAEMAKEVWSLRYQIGMSFLHFLNLSFTYFPRAIKTKIILMYLNLQVRLLGISK
jgi:hypothetical protein